MKTDDRYFKSTNFYLCAFLFSKGLELVNVDKLADPKRAIFVFRDTPDREFLVHQYNFGKEDSPDILVDARKLILAIKTLKENLYQNKF